ncbi:MAG TPA: 4-alpha-glucanotransferase [Blastocatellia bacterium]|nr:4-alpha-glucanotransferase [Blastocatellia bacterium]
MALSRSSGILLHPTSLPERYGVGDLGDSAYRFIDFLVASGQTLWQILPLGPTGYGDSPYQSFSAFAGNPLLISPQRLVDEGFLSRDDLKSVPRFPPERVDYGRVIEFKYSLLEKAFNNFNRTTDTGLRSDFLAFEQEAGEWLDSYALFRALKDDHGGRAWNTWKPELARREPGAIAQARAALHGRIEVQKFFQYLFFKQWLDLKRYCNERRVKIIGDIPIFVAYDSSDVWTHPELFKLDESGNPLAVAGVPPDYFSATGQLWGNPIYDWDRMRATGFEWWIDRLRATLRQVDMVRVDHFRGFAAAWEVPSGDKTAERGRWVEVPGRELFAALKSRLGELPIIAEDLGVITPDVESLRDDFGFPGMRILQFAFRSDSNSDLPHSYIPNTVVYTGTHDNDTSVGWFNSQAGEGSTRDAAQIERERSYCLEYLNSDGAEIHWDFIRAAFASVAEIAVVPLQDVLGLGSSARMNLPASTEGNWAWRYKAGAITGEMRNRLKKLTRLYVRNRAERAQLFEGPGEKSV